MPVSYFIKKAGVLNSFGSDVTDFLNRMSSNDFRKFGANEFKITILTTDKGRIIDLITVVNLNGRIQLITGQDNLLKVYAHLNKYLITDNAEFQISEEQFIKISVFFANSDSVIENLGINNTEKNKIHLLNEIEFSYKDNFKTETINIICHEKNLNEYKIMLSKFNELDLKEYNLLRIEKGIPEDDTELNEDINPLECGLKEYISFNKGCYIGQEVIARLDSQDKIPKQMIKLTSDVEISAGDKIYLKDKEAGFITTAESQSGKYRGLGFIRSSDLDLSQQYLVLRNHENFNINISKIN